MRRFAPLALALVVTPLAAHAQRGPRARASVAAVRVRRAPVAAARDVPVATTSAAAVPVVVAFDDVADDSVRAIITRDLANGDVIVPLAAGAPDSSAARVQIVGHEDSLTVAIGDARTGVARARRTFRLPVVPASRAAFIADSLQRALASRAASRDSTLSRLGERADSLRKLLARKPKRSWHFWGRRDANAPDPERVARDSLLRVTLRLDTLVRANARADVAATDSARRELIAEDARRRDSVRAARRWETHGVADAIQRLVTGEPGIAQSRIAYVDGDDIRIVDADGANDHVVVHGRKALSPAWRHDGRALAYSDFTDAGTQIAWVDLVTGAWRLVGATKRGLNITPAFSPDDHWLAFATASAGGGTGIVLVPARADGTFGELRHVTPPRPLDYTSPVFSPDGERIAYASARPKRPEIYSARLDGSDERIEAPVTDKTKPYRTSPDWSPDGGAIAFEQQNGRFQVWTIARGSHSPRRLTTTGENEDPTWAPDSRHLAITTTYAGVRGIWILDTVTGHRRQLTTGTDGRLAAWSPMLPTAR